MRRRFIGAAAAALTILIAHHALAASDYRLLSLGGHLVKWGEPELGSRATVTYALLTAPRQFAGARNCASLVPMEGLLAASGIAPTQLQHELESAFANWERVAGLTFKPASPEVADILIGAQAEPRGWAFTNVAEAAAPKGATSRITQSLICLNPAKTWKVGFGGDSTIYDLRYTLTHEIGHAIGLDHPGPHGQVMSFEYSEDIRELTPGDVQGAVALYGPKVADPSAVTVAGNGDRRKPAANNQSLPESSLSLGGSATPAGR